jgi:hypothetical protein
MRAVYVSYFFVGGNTFTVLVFASCIDPPFGQLSSSHTYYWGSRRPS